MIDDPVHAQSDRQALIERLTDSLGWSERYEIEFSQVAATDLKRVLEILDSQEPT